jgi:hypothetical protein
LNTAGVTERPSDEAPPPDPTAEKVAELLAQAEQISRKLDRINRILDRRERYAALYGLARFLVVFLVWWTVAGVLLKLASLR